MNNIGFGIFCFGEEYYYKGTVEKINKILDHGYHCYILTENTQYFEKRYTPSYVHVFEYNRSYKSYADKMILPKYILRNHDISILIDADTHITDYSFLKTFKDYNFKNGVSYIDTLLNHRANRKLVKDLINEESSEWKPYVDYVRRFYPEFGDFETMWEYFLVINKEGFNSDLFYNHYEKFQIVKEYCDVPLKKDVNGAGEGISIQISCKLSDTEIDRDLELYDSLKNKMISVSRRHTRPEFWPDWMK